MTKKTEKLSTQSRILNAAGELFATQGYSATTIRDICDKAEANVAAVNYHFRDKEGLYTELLKGMERELKEQAILALEIDPTSSPEERLYTFIFNILSGRLDPARPKWKLKFFHDELENPSSRAVTMLSELIQQEQAVLRSILGEILGPGVGEETLGLCSQSVFGQVFFFFHVYGPIFHDVMKKLNFDRPKQPLTRERIATFARHITDFSLAALAQFQADNHE